MADMHVLIAGAGPVGLTAAVELRRRGVACRIVDQLLEPPQYAKAVGVQPRTLEIFEGMGVLRPVLDAAIEFAGQVTYVDGQEVGRLEFPPLPDIPFGFIGIPQYETERILRERLAELGTQIERDVRLVGFEQDDEGVTATLEGPDGEETVRAAYLVGADGAHSVVRKTLGLSFEGGAFAEQYMLGDVEVDWSLPPGLAVRSTHKLEDGTVDGLVAIPLKGDGRYRMSMLVPTHLSTAAGGGDGIEHGFGSGGTPTLEDIQAVIDRLAPEPATARNLRWSSVFRISHRIVDRYSVGRVFVAGDAAHIHPPTGAQGMNTGIQDAHNLAWKLALAVSGKASATAARQLRRRAPPGRRGGRRPHRPQRPRGDRRRLGRPDLRRPPRGPAAHRLRRQPAHRRPRGRDARSRAPALPTPPGSPGRRSPARSGCSACSAATGTRLSGMRVTAPPRSPTSRPRPRRRSRPPTARWTPTSSSLPASTPAGRRSRCCATGTGSSPRVPRGGGAGLRAAPGRLPRVPGRRGRRRRPDARTSRPPSPDARSEPAGRPSARRAPRPGDRSRRVE